jgi:hypothetical protein
LAREGIVENPFNVKTQKSFYFTDPNEEMDDPFCVSVGMTTVFTGVLLIIQYNSLAHSYAVKDGTICKNLSTGLYYEKQYGTTYSEIVYY